MYNFNDAYVVDTGKISAKNPYDDNYDRKLALENNAPFFSSILKVNNQLIENAQDLKIVMPVYSLLYYSKNYMKITGSFWNYYRDGPNSWCNNGSNERTRIFYPIRNLECFNY